MIGYVQTYELRIASYKSDAERMPYLKAYQYKDATIKVVAQDFSEIMAKVVYNLQ